MSWSPYSNVFLIDILHVILFYENWSFSNVTSRQVFSWLTLPYFGLITSFSDEFTTSLFGLARRSTPKFLCACLGPIHVTIKKSQYLTLVKQYFALAHQSEIPIIEFVILCSFVQQMKWASYYVGLLLGSSFGSFTQNKRVHSPNTWLFTMVMSQLFSGLTKLEMTSQIFQATPSKGSCCRRIACTTAAIAADQAKLHTTLSTGKTQKSKLETFKPFSKKYNGELNKYSYTCRSIFYTCKIRPLTFVKLCNVFVKLHPRLVKMYSSLVKSF